MLRAICASNWLESPVSRHKVRTQAGLPSENLRALPQAPMALYRQPCRAQRHNAIRARAKVKNYTTMAATENPSGTPAHLRRLNIGPRLTACFLIIVVLMGAVDFIAAWQFKHIEVSAHRFYQVDQKSLAVMRAHVDLMEFREALVTRANAQDERGFAVEAASQRDHVVQDVRRAEETLKSFPYLDSNDAITLEAVGRSLPLQADALVQLANAGDWQGVRLRLANQVRTLVGLTSQLVHDVDQEVTLERAQALASTERARDQLAFVLSVTAALSLLMAIVFGWYATRSITGPLASLDKGAKALGSGDFQHQIEVQGEDELARLGTAFNYAARQVRELYDELKSNEARFRSLIEYSSDLILILDSEAIVRYVSPSSLRVAGRNQEELLGKCFFDFLAFEDISKMRETLRSTHTESRPAIEVGFRRPDESMAVIEVLANNLLDEPAVAGVVVNARDITERKSAEEQLKKLHQLEADLAYMNRVSVMGELAASLAHEIKQPIAAAATNAKTGLRWLQREPSDIGEAREALSRIVKDVSRAADIIDRNRSLYRRGIPQREMVNLNELIREMTALLRDAANRHYISVRADLDESLPTIAADRVQMQQVLMNLMLNGIEAMKDTSGELTVRSGKSDDGQILLSVSDLGVGLPAEKIDQVFDAFFTTKTQGTGMGLSISRRIIESHGGRLWACANTGRGATFQFTIPTEVSAFSTSADL
jgi:PAS domain S-box-containing protein